MDIPNTGAIFTLGKSHLAENTQSYFYIKNDPIRRLVAGPAQSAVICESGRLFVWGENHHGQLGIGGQHSTSTNNNNNSSNSNSTNGGIIVKPTCVKSLKTLGLKVADVSFGNGWCIILTLSNELFYTGRNIFAKDCRVTKNFAEATANNAELCEMIRKPFRLEEFDDCLSNSEEAENFTNVLAGSEHFVLLTSFGRLIGWGSNQVHQLGKSQDDLIQRPHEILLDSPVQQYTCGPESTLVLTENDKLYLTGRLNEFQFSDFTELQKNLSSTEHIIFMNISKANEIFVVTNSGSVYRSYESVRNKSLIFQRFYDYDSEENGPIWKLLKGTSFYAVLSNANKFYTTFSESGHHLKTFREISKFKNLRILDMALGDKHILVHGLPRSSTLSATMGGSVGERQHMAHSLVMANTTGGILSRIRYGKTTLDGAIANVTNPDLIKEANNKPEGEHLNEEKNSFGTDKNDFQFVANLNNNNNPGGQNEMERETSDLNQNGSVKESEESLESFETGNTVVSRKSPTKSLNSETTSTSSQNKDAETSTLSVKPLRPRTPFPESSPHGSTVSAMRKTPMRNLSYETAIKNDFMKNVTPALVESFDKESAKAPGLLISSSTPPTEPDEELRLEISESTDPLDHTVTVNEIRFINNGIDVTANVKKLKPDCLEDFVEEDDDENNIDQQIHNKSQIRKEAESFIEELEDEIDKNVESTKSYVKEKENVFQAQRDSVANKIITQRNKAKESIEHMVKETGSSIDSKIREAKECLESTAVKASEAIDVSNIVQSPRESNPSEDNRQAASQIANNVARTAAEGKDAMNSALRKIAGDTKQAVGSVTSKIATEVQDAKNAINSMLQYKKNKVDVQKPIEEQEQLPSEAPAATRESGGSKSNNTAQTNIACLQEDDERTTASANSNHTGSGGNPFESTDPFDPELDAMVQRGKKAMQEELAAAIAAGESRTQRIIDKEVEEKKTFSKFLEDIKEKSKSLTCRHEKSVKIVDDQPPHYTVDDELAVQPINSQTNGSKVCRIL